MLIFFKSGRKDPQSLLSHTLQECLVSIIPRAKGIAVSHSTDGENSQKPNVCLHDNPN